MVKITAVNGGFKIEGSFDFGYMGLYKDDQIEIIDSCEEVREWDLIEEEGPDAESCSDDELAEFLTGYMNALEQKIQKNIIKVNDNFLYNVFDDMYSCGNEFWEHKELVVPEFMPEEPDIDEIYRAADEHDISQAKDVEAYIREYLPLFNMDNFI